MDGKRICPQCGKEIGETAKFCAYCGLNLSEIELKEIDSNEKISESDQASVDVEVVDVKEDESTSKVEDNVSVEVDENETTDGLEETTMSPPPVSNESSEEKNIEGSKNTEKENNSNVDSNWIYCSVCGKKLSKDAHTCPNCGHPIKNVQTTHKSNGGGLSFGGVVMAILVALFIASLG